MAAIALEDEGETARSHVLQEGNAFPLATAQVCARMAHVVDTFCGGGSMLILKLMMTLAVVLGFLVLLVAALK